MACDCLLGEHRTYEQDLEVSEPEEASLAGQGGTSPLESVGAERAFDEVAVIDDPEEPVGQQVEEETLVVDDTTMERQVTNIISALLDSKSTWMAHPWSWWDTRAISRVSRGPEIVLSAIGTIISPPVRSSIIIPPSAVIHCR